MKRILSMLSASLMLVAASCSGEKQPAGGDGNVTFTVQLPGEMQSRAIADGTTATVLYYAAYEAGSTQALSVAPGTEEKAATLSGLQAQVSLALVTGKRYDIVFWAQAPDAPYTFNPNSRTVDMNYGTAANAENRDAFFFVVSNFLVDGPSTQSITLKRPFAQLNFATSDLADAQAGGLNVTTTAVTVKQLCPTLSLVGEGAATGTPADVTFTDAALPGVSKTVNGTLYDYISFNYLLVDATRSLVECRLVAKESDTDLRTLDVASVPVQRNYRTNIYGALLTSRTVFDVTIAPEFSDPDNNVTQP